MLRSGSWRFSVPLSDVERIFSAAMPVAIPDLDADGGGSGFAVRLADRLVPIVYASVLFGGEDVELRPDQKLVLVRTRRGELALWVDAVEDLVHYAPLDDASVSTLLLQGLASGFCAGHPSHAVLDVHCLLGA